MSDNTGNNPDGEGPDDDPDGLLKKAAEGKDLSEREHHDLLEFYLGGGELPGHEDPDELSVALGVGEKAKLFAFRIGTPLWEHYEESIARARYTDGRRGIDDFVRASVIVAYAVAAAPDEDGACLPNLGAVVVAQQKAADKKGMIPDPKRPGEKIKAPKDAAVLLRRIFEAEPGPLLELCEVALKRLKLSQFSGPSVFERETLLVEAGKG